MDNGFDWDGGELWCWDKGLCSVVAPSTPPHTPHPNTPPLYPPLPIHLSCSNHFRQLSLNPANHRLGWSVGNQTRPWLDSTPNCTALRELFTRAFAPCKRTSRPLFFWCTCRVVTILVLNAKNICLQPLNS